MPGFGHRDVSNLLSFTQRSYNQGGHLL
jgi:hypothetical protein